MERGTHLVGQVAFGCDRGQTQDSLQSASHAQPGGKHQGFDPGGQTLHLKFLLGHLSQHPLQLQVNGTAPPACELGAPPLVVHQHDLKVEG